MLQPVGIFVQQPCNPFLLASRKHPVHLENLI